MQVTRIPRGLAALLVLLFALSSLSAFAAPAPDRVRRALTEAGSPRLTADARLARLTVALASLDALPPEEALATLANLAASGGASTTSTAPRVARRAALEKARLLGLAPPDAPVAALVCTVPRTDASAPAGLVTAHTTAPAACRNASAAHTFELPPPSPSTATQLRIPVTGGETVYLAADGDLVASVVHRRGPTRHGWLGHTVGLRSGRTAADGAFPAPDQLAFELPRDASELILTIAPATAGARLSLSVARTSPEAPARPGASSSNPGPTPPVDAPDMATAPALEPPAGAPPPLPTLADTDLFGHAARRLLGLPDLGPSLEERLGLETFATPPDAPAPDAPPDTAPPATGARAARPLTPAAEDLVLALPAVHRADQRASVLGLHLPRAGRQSHLLELALAHLALDRGHLERARALRDALPDTTRESAAGRYLSARLARYAGHPEDTLALYPGLDPALSTLERLELAQAATELGRADLSAALRKDLAVLLPGRLDLGTTAMAALVSAGDIASALSFADTLADRHRERPLIALDAAERHLAHDSPASRERALTLTLRALDTSALDADALVRAALLLEALDNAPDGLARATFARALAASPGHPTARRHLERLDNTSESIRNPLTPPALGPEDPGLAALLALPVRDESAPFEVLAEEIVVEIAPDGTTTRWVRRVLRAQRVPEQREGRTLRVRFDPSRESVTVLSAHVYRQGPRPRREAVVERHVHSLTEDWYGLYYDLRQLSIPFDRLERGDLVEVSWRVDPVGQLFPGVVDLFEILSDRIPKHQLRLTVTHPRALALQHRLSLPPGYRAPLTTTESTDGDLTHLTVTGRDLPALPLEPLAPGTAELAPVWQVTSFTSWDELARWYTRLIEPSRVVTPALRELVARLTRNRTKDESIRVITSWVTREIRYVGLEFGIHGYRPYRTDEVFARRFGDCKDKATLLTTLLSIAGIDSSVVLVRTRKQGRLDGALPSLALFDHAIAWLPSRLQLVDPTAIHYGLGELPREDQGAQILTLPASTQAGSEAATLTLSPADPASRNGIVGRYAVTIDSLGRGGLSAEVSMLGVHAPLYRSMLLEPATRNKRFEEVLNRRYPGLSLTSLEVSDPADHNRPVDLVFTADVPRLASRSTREPTPKHDPGTTPTPAENAPATSAAPSLHIPRPAGVDGQLERLAPESSRTLPLYLGPPTRWDLRFRYVFPERYQVSRLPPGGENESPFGRYRVRFVVDPLAPHTIDVETELELTVDQVSAADYPALREFLAAFDRAVATALVAHPAPTPGDPDPPPAPPAPTAPTAPAGPATPTPTSAPTQEGPAP